VKLQVTHTKPIFRSALPRCVHHVFVCLVFVCVFVCYITRARTHVNVCTCSIYSVHSVTSRFAYFNKFSVFYVLQVDKSTWVDRQQATLAIKALCTLQGRHAKVGVVFTAFAFATCAHVYVHTGAYVRMLSELHP
jgi:hypothetical protein